MVPCLPLLSCESSVFVKENPDRKKKDEKKIRNLIEQYRYFSGSQISVVMKLLQIPQLYHITFLVNNESII